MNHYISLFPEFSLWYKRWSRWNTNSKKKVNDYEKRDLLWSGIHKENGGLPALQAASSNGTGEGTTTLSLSCSEAALTVCVAVRYFSEHIARLPAVDLYKNHGKISCHTSHLFGLAPPFSSVATAYVSSLPMKLFLDRGVESLFLSSYASLSSLHICLEQLSWNLRDEILQYANDVEYSILDAHPSSLDEILLAALYVVRSRILPATLLHPENSDRVIHALMPGVDALNHAVHPNAAVVASPCLQSVVVRSVRDIMRREEVTLNYDAPLGKMENPSTRNHFITRFLMEDCKEKCH